MLVWLITPHNYWLMLYSNSNLEWNTYFLANWNCLPVKWNFFLPFKEFNFYPGVHAVLITSHIFKVPSKRTADSYNLSLSFFVNKMLTFSCAVDNTQNLTGGLFFSLK